MQNDILGRTPGSEFVQARLPVIESSVGTKLHRGLLTTHARISIVADVFFDSVLGLRSERKAFTRGEVSGCSGSRCYVSQRDLIVGECVLACLLFRLRYRW